jgi:intracellular multiplication protein IcmK
MKIYRRESRLSRLSRIALFTGAFLALSPVVNAAPAATDATPAPSIAAPNATTNLKDIPPPSPEGIAIPAPPPLSALSPEAPSSPNANNPAENIPPPPAPSALLTNAAQLAAQAEQAALQAQAQAESEQARRDQEHVQKSYERAAAGLLPLSPDQIRDFMRKLEQTQAAAIPPSTGQPKGEVRIATLELDPGVEPPQINLAAGYVTTITIMDASGAPWPIVDVGVGGNFEVSPSSVVASDQKGTHVIRVMPLTRYGTGDLSVLLKDFSTPIVFRLASGGPSVDLRYDARIPRLGPNGQAPLIERPKIEAGDQNMMMILENAPPSGAKRVKISGLDARTMAWSLDNKVFVRTPLTLLSPAWNSSVASADGMKVYEIGNAPVLLMSDNGAMLRGRLIEEDGND